MLNSMLRILSSLHAIHYIGLISVVQGHHLGGKFTSTTETMWLPNESFNKSVVARAEWYIAPSAPAHHDYASDEQQHQLS